jgi:hypothetical protein
MCAAHVGQMVLLSQATMSRDIVHGELTPPDQEDFNVAVSKNGS